jgi:hypothetical protein
MTPTDDGGGPAPIDRPVLEWLRSRLAGTRTFESAEIVTDGKVHLHAALSDDYYPGRTNASLDIRWYRNDDFSIHYRETRSDGTWQCRWDRHPNAHNARDHFHPPRDASQTEAEDAHWPADHRDVIGPVLDRIEERIDSLWERQ